MTVSLLQNFSMVGFGAQQNFVAVGGTSPYTYSVLAGGIGGTIDPLTGLYTAPSSVGQDTINVIDSVGLKANAAINVGSSIHLVMDILRNELGLASGRVYLYEQKIMMPTDTGLFIAVGILNIKPFGNKRLIDSSMNENQSVNVKADLSIDVISRDTSALLRKEEILMALNSVYAEQQMEAFSFKIFPLTTSFVNISGIDGAAVPYRFNLTVALQYFVKKTAGIDYFDIFNIPQVVTNA